MKAILLDGARNLVEGELESPEVGPRDVLIEVHTMGICGSDIEYFLHNRIGPFIPQGPLVLGHELSGTVVQRGGEVQIPAVGTRVTIDPSIPCRVCRYCRVGRHNICENLKFLGTAATVPHIPGGLGQFVSVPAVNCYVLPDDISWGEGACLEPLCVAVHAALRPGGLAGAKVLVSGGGTIGQLTAAAVRAFGAAVVAVSDLQPFRREFARDRGADMALDPVDSDAMEAAARGCGGFDVIFDASGAPAAVKSNLETVNKGGTIVQIGTIPREVELPINLMMSKELRMMGSFRYGEVYPTAMNLLSTRRVDVRPFITDSYPISRTVPAFERAAEQGETIKLQVDHS